MSNNRIKKLTPKQNVLKSYVAIGLTEDSRFVWQTKNIANLFEVLGYIDLARDEVKKRIREVPVK